MESEGPPQTVAGQPELVREILDLARLFEEAPINLRESETQNTAI